MATRAIETKMIDLINDPATTVGTLRTAYETEAAKLKCKKLHSDVMAAALKRKDVGMIDFLANRAGVAGGVRSAVFITAFFEKVPDAAFDALDLAFEGKSHRETMNGLVSVSEKWWPNGAQCFERAYARYHESPTKSALTSLVFKPKMSEFETWSPILLRFFTASDCKKIEIDRCTLRRLVYSDPARWEERLVKMEETGFVLDVDTLRSSLRDIADTRYTEFVNKRIRHRAALRSAISKKKAKEIGHLARIH
ncbi:hypothetical protein N9S30_00235 [bacterium]|nr:hypothetical protein [bacterium]